MADSWWIVVLLGAAAAIIVLFVWRPIRAATREAQLSRARRTFHTQRERLEMKFIHLAAAHATAAGPHWADCDFADGVAYVRNRNTKELAAFVAVTVAMDSFDPSPVGISDFVGNLHVATAVFRYDRDHWETDGRAILNLTPSEAVQYYREQLEMVSEEFAHHS
jgi:hypothetical protein